MSAFAGFGPDLFAFLKGLKANNNKAWFDKHRADYEEHVKGPVGDFVEALAAACAKAKLPFTGDRKRSPFRLNRDVRFSKDKSPYKTNAGAVLTATGDKKEPGMLYLHFEPGGSFFASGYYMPEPPTLHALRAGVMADPKGFLKVVKVLEKAGIPLESEYSLKRLPKGFEEAGEAIADFVKYTSFVVSKPLDDSEVLSANLVKQAVEFAKKALPLVQFGAKAL